MSARTLQPLRLQRIDATNRALSPVAVLVPFVVFNSTKPVSPAGGMISDLSADRAEVVVPTSLRMRLHGLERVCSPIYKQTPVVLDDLGTCSQEVRRGEHCRLYNWGRAVAPREPLVVLSFPALMGACRTRTLKPQRIPLTTFRR